MDVPDYQKKRELVAACLHGFDKSVLSAYIDDVPEALVSDAELADLGITNPTYETITGSARLIQNVLYRNTNAAESAFALSPSAKSCLERFRMSIGGDRDVATIAKNISTIIKRTKEENPQLTITKEELVDLAQAASKDARPLILEMLVEVANKTTVAGDKTQYLERALQIFGSSSWTESHERDFGPYEWNTLNMRYLQHPNAQHLIKAADSLRYCMERSPEMLKIIAQKLASSNLTPEKTVNEALREEAMHTDFGFLEEFALASLSVDTGMRDPVEIYGLKNVYLEQLMMATPESLGGAILSLFNRTEREFPIHDKNRNILTISQRVFNRIVRDFDKDQLGKMGLKLENIKVQDPKTYLIRGLKYTGETLGINWDEVQSWEDVKKSQREVKDSLTV